tara:strand:- start:107 stop:325 length:219 start_codon:yes stop_codon:yes gene_type:complete
MSSLTERRDERKAEAQALADKYNALTEQIQKAQGEANNILEEFKTKNGQLQELELLVQEETAPTEAEPATEG